MSHPYCPMKRGSAFQSGMWKLVDQGDQEGVAFEVECPCTSKCMWTGRGYAWLATPSLPVLDTVRAEGVYGRGLVVR
jgi:hypothetical protein